MTAVASIRLPAVAGMFYPARADELQKQIRGFFDSVTPHGVKTKVRGVIAPHAGYVYSGFTAAHAYSLLRGSTYETVVVISPSHSEYFGGISIYPGDAFETPLGKVTINSGLRERLVGSCELIQMSAAGHRAEHALEVQLPFLQVALGTFSLLPIVLGDQQKEYCLRLGEALAEVLETEDALIVASTDLSHYHPSDIAEKLDSVVAEDLRTFNYGELLAHLESGKAEACGGGPVVAMMLALDKLGANKIEILHQCNSGDVSGDRQAVVGYLSAVVYSSPVNLG